MIKQKLEDAGIPNPSGEDEWKTSVIKAILANEKYCGGALGQKTFKDNLMSGRIVKNTGQLPMVLVQNNHPAIVSREMYQAVQAELARRNAGRSPSQKSAPTGRSCYASNSAASSKESLTARVTDALMAEMAALPGSGKILGEIQQRLDTLDREFDSLLSRTENAEENAARFKALSDEMTSLKAQREKIAAQLRKNGAAGERARNAVSAVKQINHQLTEWDESLIRQLVHTVKVISASHIQVCLMDGTVIEQEVRKQSEPFL